MGMYENIPVYMTITTITIWLQTRPGPDLAQSRSTQDQGQSSSISASYLAEKPPCSFDLYLAGPAQEETFKANW